MNDGRFARLDRLLNRGNPAEVIYNPGDALDYLIEEFRQEKNHSIVFQARLMKTRQQLGLPLIQTEDIAGFPPELRRPYEEAFIEAAREAGASFLADGDIVGAWPYFRALGETDLIADAIDRAEPGDDIESVIAIAFQEGVHPAKGLDLILAQHGMCRAITSFGMVAVTKGRKECLQILARGLYTEVVGRIRETITRAEGSDPATDHLPTLIASRPWLFGEYDYYVDTSHLMSVLQYSPEVTDVNTIRILRQLCEYGQRLSPQFTQRGYPPFEEPYLDYAKLLDAYLGIDPETAVAHFRQKVYTYDIEQTGTGPAQQFVKLLLRLGRHPEALTVAQDFLADVPPQELSCPSVLQICCLAGEYEVLMKLAREKGDLLSYAAAGLERHGWTD